MKKKIIQMLIVAVMLLSKLYATQVNSFVLYFEKDRAELKTEELNKLNALKQADLVILNGHTDADGSDAYNATLSKRRVEEVKRRIAQLDAGIKIETGYFGESKPLNNNLGENEKTENRRVEIKYVCDPVLRIKTPIQFYEIDPRKENTIDCREGTKIQIPAGAFEGKSVLIKVSEYYNAANIFSANLSTRCNNAPIESAGMLNITAEVNGENAEPNMPLKFKFPRNNKNKDFKIFEGVRNENFQMNWVLGKAELPANTPVISRDSTLATAFDWSENTYSSLGYTATIYGDVLGQLGPFWSNLLDSRKVDDLLVIGCLKNSIVDIIVNKAGQITDVKTNNSGKQYDCNLSVQKYIRTCLPQRFQALKWESKIHIDFEATDQISPVVTDGPLATGNNTWSSGFGNEFNADYETDNIVLSSLKLGWINCDRFLTGYKLVDYTVQTDTDATVRGILKKYKSFFSNEYLSEDLSATTKAKTNRKFIFRRIPDNEEIVLVSTKKVEGKIFLAVESTKISAAPFSKFNYKEVSQKELETAMKNLPL